MGRHLVPVLVVAALLAAGATAGPRRSSVHEEVTVERVQVDVIVLPRGEDPQSCRQLVPGDLRAVVGGEEWQVEAIDWDEAGVREERSIDAEDGCLQLAVYLGRFSWVPWFECPGDPRINSDTPYVPPPGRSRGDTEDAFLVAEEIARGLRECDRIAFYTIQGGVLWHTKWKSGLDQGLAALVDLRRALRQRGIDSSVVLEQPWEGGWQMLVPSLAAVHGRKDLLLLDTSDHVHVFGSNPERIARLAEDARRARVTIHRVDLAPEVRSYVPASAEPLATGGLVIRGGARARVVEEIRRRAWCRARVTLVPPAGARRERYRTVTLEDRRGRFDLAGTSWLVDEESSEEEALASYLGAGEGDMGLAVEVEEVGGCEAAGGGLLSCEARVLVRPTGVLPVEPGAAGVAVWKSSRTEFSRVYGLEAGGAVEGVRRIRLPFTSGRGKRTVCVLLFDRAGTFLGSGCRGIVVPPDSTSLAARR